MSCSIWGCCRPAEGLSATPRACPESMCVAPWCCHQVLTKKKTVRRAGGLWRAYIHRAASGSTGRPNLAEVGRQNRAAKLANDPTLQGLQPLLWRELPNIAMKAARQGKARAKAAPEAETDTVGIEGQLLGASSLQHCLRAGRQQARRERLAATSALIHGEQPCCNH